MPLSKFLARVLRHQAQDFDLVLDEAGFAPLSAVWTLIDRQFKGQYRYEDLLRVVDGDQHGKKRFDIQGNGIRALFGHSSVTDIVYEPIVPPPTLYHGTYEQALASIQREGLLAQARQYVHLTTSLTRAKMVGERHSGRTIVLVIDALRAYNDGILFFQPEPEHFLAKAIPTPYIDFDKQP